MVMSGDSPRHVRDIAHLYLSGMRRPPQGRVRLAVAGMSADVMPAFHVANLALAAAARGAAVRVEERSGLPANAGCFLGLHPRCWIVGDDSISQPVSAFARVSFLLGGNGVPISHPSVAENEVEIVHVPPWDSGAEHAEEMARLTAPAIVLYLAERGAEPRPWCERNGDAIRRVAFVAGAVRAGLEEGCVGVFTRWKRALTDPLPVVVRDPESHLSRQYRNALSTLLAGAVPAPPVAPTAVELHAASSSGSR